MAIIDFSSNPSLNEIVSSLAARVDKQHDVGFLDELKHIVNYKRKAAIHEWLVSNPANWTYFIQTIVIETERVNANECEEYVPPDCYVVRTVCTLPAPLRDGQALYGWQLFEYVGHSSGYMPYKWAQPEFYAINQANRYTSGKKSWYYSGGYIYIISETEDPPPPVKVRGVFEDALDLQACDPCNEAGSTGCINDGEPYPIPPELLDSIVRSILSTELSVGSMPNENKENKEDHNVDTVRATSNISQE